MIKLLGVLTITFSIVLTGHAEAALLDTLKDCEKLLSQRVGTFDLEHFSRVKVRGNEDYSIRQVANESDRAVEVRISKTHFPYEEFKGTAIQFNDETYRLVDIGGLQEREDQEIITDTLSQALPWSEARVVFEGKKSSALKFLFSAQRLINLRIIKGYLGRKSYLGFGDELDLTGFPRENAPSSNQFVLIKSSLEPTSPLFTPQFIEEHAVATVALARVPVRDFSLPKGLDSSYYQVLPHSFRMESHDSDVRRSNRETSKELDKPLLNFLKGRSVAEVTRLYKFDPNLPKILQEYLLLKVMHEAKYGSAPVDVLLASVDPITRRLFEREFGFTFVPGVSDFMPEDIAATPTAVERKESRLFLDCNSDQFKKLYDKFTDDLEKADLIPGLI